MNVGFCLFGFGIFAVGYFLGSEMQRARDQADKLDDQKLIKHQRREIETLSRSNAAYAVIVECKEPLVLIREHDYSVN